MTYEEFVFRNLPHIVFCENCPYSTSMCPPVNCLNDFENEGIICERWLALNEK